MAAEKVSAADLPAPTESTEAAGLLAEADAAFGSGNFLLALQKMQDAYEIAPQPRLLANKALVLEKLGRFREAAATMEAYLATDPSAAKRELGETFLARVRPEVKLTSDPAGAAVFLDDATEPVGTTPIATRLAIGRYTARLRLEGYQDATDPIDVKPGEPVTRVVTLKPVPSWGRTEWGFVSAGAGVVGGVVGGVMVALASAEADERDSASSLGAWHDHNNSAQDLGRGSIVAFAVGTAALGAGVYLIVTGSSSSGDSDSSRQAPVDQGIEQTRSRWGWGVAPFGWQGRF